MGVSGAGKSTIGNMLEETLACACLDANDFHSLSNREKMQHGIALSDEDRIPWLENLQESLRERLLNGETVVSTCSSLKKQYREILRGSDLDYKQESYSSCKKRASKGEYFMPLTLL
ncbi:hypothetical protein N665_2389s0005 [Sinapis alba]|nr:hypothetical protein N665_2389s0005 [Sinapis alba]